MHVVTWGCGREQGGARALALDTARILGPAEAPSIAVAAASELLHNASLVHDDLQDGTPRVAGNLRSGPRFGAASALCAGDLLVIRRLCSTRIPAATSRTGRAVAVMHEAVAATIAGQVDDLSGDIGFVVRARQSILPARSRDR